MRKLYDDLELFCAVVEAGSLKGASSTLGVPHSTVSRRIEALEREMGLSLLQRTTRQLKVTSLGEQIYQDCSPMLRSIKDSLTLAKEREQSFQGSLKVSMPVRAGLDFLGCWMLDFAADHPRMQLEMELSDTYEDMIHRDIDLAFRVGPLSDSSAVASRLWDIPYTLLAHPELLERHGVQGRILDISQLEQLPCIQVKPVMKWGFCSQEGQILYVQPGQGARVNDLALAHHAAGLGLGIVFGPREMHRNKDLVELQVEGWQPIQRTMYAYHIGKRHLNSRIQAIAEYVRQRRIQWETERNL
ncbi:LysR family transcriptional regulator [Ferrimonas sp. YFM]|uniref:LysR family transcriptional regulator n=1 Tax=Ferrimonas sp. YFM TaxID=3028878 RepID=UPI0025744D15|nr:LysR family transcriptional regulator [Ferrimonas sp. YFM]BDY04173.1 LysR family transcriptional regulator [Ferrimonas sp. YFM]